MQGRRVVAAAVVALSAPLVACSSEDPTKVPLQRVKVDTVDEVVRVPARLDAGRVLPVATPAPGTVAEVFVGNGDEVVAGQPIMRIDAPLVDQLLSQGSGGSRTSAACSSLRRSPRSAMPSASAGLQQIQDAYRGVLASVLRARDALAAVTLPAPQLPALPDLPDLPDLPQPPVTPPLPPLPDGVELPDPELVGGLVRGEIDQARAQLETSRQALDRASAELSAGVGGAALALDAAMTSVRASVDAAQRSAEEAQRTARAVTEAALCGQTRERTTMLENIRERLLVRAPADGLVVFGAAPDSGPSLPAGGESFLGDLTSMFAGSSSSRLFQGSEIGIGQTLFTLYDTSSYVAVADFDEGQVVQLFEGAPATVVVESADERLEGSLTFVSPVRTGGTEQPVFRGEVSIAPPPAEATQVSTGSASRRIAVGMTAQVEVHLRSIGPSMVVPESALLRDDAGTVVFVVEDGRARAREVDVLGTDGTTAAVKGSELRSGDRVILAPRTVEDGERVAS
ncbi:MAG TPA: biotin/lipoyl-binding protein [Acidimicrobiales bacterium]|nr:biotin/lipoyl-binding protein [Acidimicrobiales bacterium]